MQPPGMRRVMHGGEGGGGGGAREIQDSPDAICMILTFLHLLHPPRASPFTAPSLCGRFMSRRTSLFALLHITCHFFPSRVALDARGLKR